MRIKPLILLMFSLAGFGCTAHHFGSIPSTVNQVVADACVKRLESLYPPALTRFYLKPAKDPFNLQLNQRLRQTGYSINEVTAETMNAQGLQSVSLQAFVDEPIKGSLIRVTLMIEHQSLSRAYQIKKGVIRPLGLWVRKESSQ